MSVGARRPPISIGGLALVLRRLELVWPTLATAVVLAILIGGQLEAHHGNPAAFVVFGRNAIDATRPPPGAPIANASGYDGQFYWLLANDPLLLHRFTIDGLTAWWPGYHFQRVAYPALSWLASGGGQRSVLPWTMLAINVLAILALTAGFTVYARRRGWNPAWAFVVGLMPGLLMPALRDLSDVLSTTCMFGGLLFWQRGRPWWTALLLGLAALSREPMALAVGAIGVDIAGRCRAARGERGAVLDVLRHSWPAVVMPAAAFLGWQLYIHTLHAPSAAATGLPLFPPFNDFVVEIRRVLHQDSPLQACWELAYIALTVAGIVVAFSLLRRGTSAPVVMGPLVALYLPVVAFGDQWGLTRYTAPLFLVLLLAGLEQRSRAALTISAAAAGLTALIALVL